MTLSTGNSLLSSIPRILGFFDLSLDTRAFQHPLFPEISNQTHLNSLLTPTTFQNFLEIVYPSFLASMQKIYQYQTIIEIRCWREAATRSTSYLEIMISFNIGSVK